MRARLAMVAVLCVVAAASGQEPAADLVLLNARVYTLDAARPWAEAVAIRGDRIAAVGSRVDVARLAGAGTRTLELGGAFVSPGFNDSHVHNERVLTETGLAGRDHRWRVIHAQVVHPDDFKRFGQLKLVAEVNPYHVSDDMRWMEERIGPERSRGAYAFRTLKNAGAVLVFGSDSPGTNAARYYLSPLYGLYAAVSRQTLGGEPASGWFPAERLTIEEAIEAYTKGPAWASFEEDLKGTVGVGKLADLAVFDTNLVEVGRSEPARLLKARVLYTIAGGTVVYERAPGRTSGAR